MITTTCFCISAYSISFTVRLSCNSLVVLKAIMKIILVNKVFSSVVGWVYIYHFNLAMVALLQKL